MAAVARAFGVPGTGAVTATWLKVEFFITDG
jgi:hypothetical protein